MVGKPNLPKDFHLKGTAIKGSAVSDACLDALDQERAASMADEGGAAATGTHSNHHYVRIREKSRMSRRAMRGAGFGLAVGVLLGFWLTPSKAAY